MVHFIPSASLVDGVDRGLIW